MNIKTNTLLMVAERHYRQHLKNKPQDDDESAMLAIRASLSQELSAPIASVVLHDPALSARLQKIRQTLNLGIAL